MAAMVATPVHVQLRRTGGIAGIELRSRLDSAQLPEHRARELEALVAALPPEPARGMPLPPMVPDAMSYELQVDRGGQRSTFRYSDTNMPPEVRTLVQHLVAAAGRQA